MKSFRSFLLGAAALFALGAASPSLALNLNDPETIFLIEEVERSQALYLELEAKRDALKAGAPFAVAGKAGQATLTIAPTYRQALANFKRLDVEAPQSFWQKMGRAREYAYHRNSFDPADLGARPINGLAFESLLDLSNGRAFTSWQPRPLGYRAFFEPVFPMGDKPTEYTLGGSDIPLRWAKEKAGLQDGLLTAFEVVGDFVAPSDGRHTLMMSFHLPRLEPASATDNIRVAIAGAIEFTDERYISLVENVMARKGPAALDEQTGMVDGLLPMPTRYVVHEVTLLESLDRALVHTTPELKRGQAFPVRLRFLIDHDLESTKAAAFAQQLMADGFVRLSYAAPGDVSARPLIGGGECRGGLCFEGPAKPGSLSFEAPRTSRHQAGAPIEPGKKAKLQPEPKKAEPKTEKKTETAMSVPETSLQTAPQQPVDEAVAAPNDDPQPAPPQVETPRKEEPETSAVDMEREMMKMKQRMLLEIGYSIGIADGIAGPKTRSALAHFARRTLMQPGEDLIATLGDAIDGVRTLTFGVAASPAFPSALGSTLNEEHYRAVDRVASLALRTGQTRFEDLGPVRVVVTAPRITPTSQTTATADYIVQITTPAGVEERNHRVQLRR